MKRGRGARRDARLTDGVQTPKDTHYLDRTRVCATGVRALVPRQVLRQMDPEDLGRLGVSSPGGGRVTTSQLTLGVSALHTLYYVHVTPRLKRKNCSSGNSSGKATCVSSNSLVRGRPTAPTPQLCRPVLPSRRALSSHKGAPAGCRLRGRVPCVWIMTQLPEWSVASRKTLGFCPHPSHFFQI